MELVIDSLVIGSLVQYMSSGGCGLRKTLGSLSADGYCFVPAQLVF